MTFQSSRPSNEKMNPEVSTYIESLTKWKTEIGLLREIVLETPLVEAFKWKQPCYTFKNKNVLMVSSFKECCFVSFLKGVLLEDSGGRLVFPGENSQAVKMLKFSSVAEIKDLREIILDYVHEAIKNEKVGKKVTFKEVEAFDYPSELKDAFEEDSNFRNAFEALTKGRQKGYLLQFSGAKHSATRVTRIQNLKSRILDGYGLRDCTCQHSKRMPNCDGSHKYL